MVFESIVADLLNRFLGDYIENLDSKQLNVGIYGGDIVLKNLDLRRTALDKFHLPIKLHSGSLGTLTLKVPWQNLYTEAVLVSIKELYLVATPNLGIKFDQAQEEKQAQDAKQRELERIKEQRKAKRKNPTAVDPQDQDTFAERLTMQIIKNLQITIHDIHFRYEDEFTNPSRPFAAGVTLHKLAFETTDEKWKPRVVKEAVKMFYKIVDVDCFSVYWNSPSKLISRMKKDDAKVAMASMIASKGSKPKDFNYILSPICMSAHLRMNPKPEADGSKYSIPKILLSINMEDLCFHIGKYQYQDILEFLDAQERLRLNALYRKYRPELRSYEGHEKEWWCFALLCTMKEEVERKATNWSWSHMKAHRDLLQKYRDAWVEKQTNKSPSKAVLQTIQKAEKDLDVFNLNIARQKADLYIDRKNLKRIEEHGGYLDYFKGWWRGGSTVTPKSEINIAATIEKAMTPDERAKLYGAIDYRGDQKATTYPKEFVDNKVSFSLAKLMVVLDDDLSEKKRMEVMIMTLNTVNAHFEQRSSANAIKLSTIIKNFVVEGIRTTAGSSPVLVSKAVINKEREKDLPQLLFEFETNPLDGSFDHFVMLRTLPLSVVYHAASVNKVVEVFRPPESLRFEQLAAAAFARYVDMKEWSATGLQYALQNRAVLKVDINMLPTIVQIPDRGVMGTSSKVLVLDLGSLSVATSDMSKLKVDEEFRKKPEDEKLTLLRERAFDKFDIKLESLQILFARSGDDWKDARTKKSSHIRLLQPTGFSILLEKAAINDQRLPKLKISGHFPDLHLAASDTRLLDVMKVLISIPTPPPTPKSPGNILSEDIENIQSNTMDRAKMKLILEATGEGVRETQETEADKKTMKQKNEGNASAKISTRDINDEEIQLELSMILKEITISISRDKKGTSQPYFNLLLISIGTACKLRPLDMCAVLSLGGIRFEHLQCTVPGKSDALRLLESIKTSTSTPLLQISYSQADKQSPFFASEFNKVKQLIRITGQPLNMVLHQEALVDLRNFVEPFLTKISELKKTPTTGTTNAAAPSSNVTVSEQPTAKKLKVDRVSTAAVDLGISMEVHATVSGLRILVGTSKAIFSDLSIEGFVAKIVSRPTTIEANIRLESIGIVYPSSATQYHQILSCADKEIVRFRYIEHVRTEEQKRSMKLADFDRALSGTFAEVRVIFMYSWWTEFMAWLTPFQGTASVAAGKAAAAVQDGARNAIASKQEPERLTKLKLNFEIDAPVIILPKNSTSNEGILINLGQLTVSNRFSTKPIRNESSFVASFETIALVLTDAKLSRIITDDDRWPPKAECLLVKPVSFLLDITRNLSFDTFKQSPAIFIKGTLPLLMLCATMEDYQVTMKTLSENFAEAEPKQVDTEASKNGQDLTGPKSEAKSGTESASVTTRSTAAKLEYKFEIENVLALLYDGSTNLTAGVVEHDAKRSLAMIELKSVTARGAMLEDGSMKVVCYLFAFTIDDKRVGHVGITRLMDKKGGNEANRNNMMDVLYTKDASANQKAELTLRPVFFYLNPDFLGALSRFVSGGSSEISREEQNEAVEPAESGKVAESSKVTDKSEAPVGTMDLRMFVEDPEVVIVENALEPDKTQAIMLKFRAEIHKEDRPDKSTLTAGVLGLEIMSGYFALEKRDTNTEVLSSCGIALYSITPKGAGQTIKIESSPLKMRVSPSVIRLWNAISASFMSSKASPLHETPTLVARRHLWDQKPIEECNFWFLNEVLNVEEAIEELFTPVENLIFDESKEDKCRLDMEKIEITLEADSGAGMVPMVHFIASVHADVRDWSKLMHAEAVLSLEVWYFNEQYNVWEPFLEPVFDKDGTRHAWQLETYIAQHNEYERSEPDMFMQPPKMSIAILGVDKLQLTVTKTVLDLSTELSDAFSRSTRLIERQKLKGEILDAPWSICNASGEPVEVMDSEAFSPGDDWRDAMPCSSTVELVCKVRCQNIGAEDDRLPMLLMLRFPGLEEFRQVDVARAEKRIFGMPKEMPLEKQRYVVVETSSQYGKKLVVIRSMVKIINHLPIDLIVHCGETNNLQVVSMVDSDGGELNVPLYAIYSTASDLFIQPTGDKNGMGSQAIPWRQFKRDWHRIIVCPSVDGDHKKDYFVRASVDVQDAYYENTHRKNLDMPCYVIHFTAPTLLRNALPYPLKISAIGFETLALEPGAFVSFCSVVPGKIVRFEVHANIVWTCELEIEENFEELTQHTFHGLNAANVPVEIDFGLRTSSNCGTEEMTLYCPFWMINKTGLRLEYKVAGKFRSVRRKRSSSTKPSGSRSPVRKCSKSPTRSKSLKVSEFAHEPGADDPLLFSFPGTLFFSKNKKAFFKVGGCENWSEKFPLDVVGSSGRIWCKTKGDKEYEVGIKIEMSQSGLTKICTFTPFYLINNRTNVDVEVRQSAIGDLIRWLRVPPDQCVGFWPEKKKKPMQMCCRYVGASDPERAESQPFSLTESFESLVTMPNEFVGVYVSSQVSDYSVLVTLEQYQDGFAPVLLVNHTVDLDVQYRQKGVYEVNVLAPQYCVLFSWTSAMMKRLLLWSCGNAKDVEDDLMMDGMAEIKPTKVYWVSFMSGRQRVLLFTTDLAIATTASKPYELERIDKQYTLCLQSIDISLVNNLAGMEVASVAITSSGVVWEYKKRRYKPFSVLDNKGLEDAYVKYCNDKFEGKQPKSRVVVGPKTEVDFEEMKQYQPRQTSIRRSFQSGLLLQYMQSQHEQQFHLKINYVQMDNQLSQCVFATVLAPVPPSKSVAAEVLPRPFIEVSFIMRQEEHSNMAQIKYFMVLVQEMLLQADKGFINAMTDMFTSQNAMPYDAERYGKDMDIVNKQLAEFAATTSSTEQKAYYEFLHFSPVKIQVSFSQGGGDDSGRKSEPIHSEFVNLLLKSVGVTLTEIQNAQFQLAYMERKAAFLSRQQVQQQAISHYTKQFIKQLYVLVLGLDIMGNPFGLIRDLSTGVETFFYEPVQGAIQGPEELAEGVAIGLRGLFHGAVGGTAGAVSRITGTLGKGIAALTLDDEYQKKRQQMLSKRPATAHEGLVHGAKGLAMGFIEGVTGVFTKPIEGGKKGGVGGFAKGVGRGVVGLVTKPVSGLFDFFSNALQAVKRATDMSEAVRKLRPARFVEPDKIIRPFSLTSAEGNQMLQESGKGKYASTDVYVAHAPITVDKQYYCVLTDNRIMVVSKSLDAFDIDWQFHWRDLAEAPEMIEPGLKVKLKEQRRKLLGLGPDVQGKVVKFADRRVGEMIAARAKEAFERAQ